MKKNTIKRALATAAALLLGLTAGGGTTLTVKAEDLTTTYNPNGTATASAGNGPASITINLPKTQGAESGNNSTDNTQYVYKIYKVFDAVPGTVAEGSSTTNTVSYSVMDSKKNVEGTTDAEKAGFTTDNGMGTYFDVDAAYNVSVKDAAKVGGDGSDKDNLNQGAVNAIKAYVGSDGEVASVPVNIKNNSVPVTSLTVSGLDYGYYYITTTTGSVVTVDTTHPTATVDDKNSVPTVTKTIYSVDDGEDADHVKGSVDTNGKNAIAEVGSTVTFNTVITVGKGAKNYVYHDKMGSGLQFDPTSYLNISYKNPDMETALSLTKDTDYTLKSGSDITDGDTFDLVFTETGLSKLNEGGTISLQYTAKVTSDALRAEEEGNTDDANGKNTAKVEYGNNNYTTEDTTRVYNAKITVTKNFDGLTGDTQLSNNDSAEFVLKNNDGNYYSINSNKVVSWVDDETNATKISFTKSGESKEFTGLSDGTYTLTESKVPAGYNKAADQNITISDAYSENAFANSNLEKTANVENKQGSVLPSTGGIGTTIFYVAGIALIIGAAVVLISRKHKQDA